LKELFFLIPTQSQPIEILEDVLNCSLVTGPGMRCSFLGELRQGRFAARRGCLVIARHENSFGGLLCLATKFLTGLLRLALERTQNTRKHIEILIGNLEILQRQSALKELFFLIPTQSSQL
jgi:hypothetical protein